ncbi:hypothetical protein Dimus_030931 [Dionaea muscipula]
MEYHLLATISFDINIELPYGPLVAALKKLNIAHGDVLQVAWNFVNDCGLILASPSSREKPWWLEFEVSPKRLQGIIKLLGGCFEYEKVDILLTTPSATEFKREMRSSSKSCISTSDHMDRVDVTGERWHDPLLIKSSQNPAANIPYLDQHGSKFQSSNRRSSKDIMDHSVVENASRTKKVPLTTEHNGGYTLMFPCTTTTGSVLLHIYGVISYISQLSFLVPVALHSDGVV